MDRDGFGDDSYSDHIKIKLEGEFLSQAPNNFAIHRDGKLAYGCLDIDPNRYAVDFVFSIYGTDCDDTNADIHPGSVWYYDNDGDGDGDPNRSKVFNCAPDPKYVKRPAADCNDNDDDIYTSSIWYHDSDGDGEANLNDTKFFDCEPDDGYIKRPTTDCNDNNNQIHSKTIWYFDADGDGYGGPTTLVSCNPPANYYLTSDDCNDNDPLLHPKTVWYIDNDGDGWGGDDFVQSCTQPTGYVSRSLQSKKSNGITKENSYQLHYLIPTI